MSQNIASPPSAIPLRVLLVEDVEVDAEIVLRELRKGGFNPAWERVATADAMRAALKDWSWDLIISDHCLPQFSSLGALELLRELELDLPLVVVSGVAPEAVVTELMRAGARDFISKDALSRLAPAVSRELEESKVRHERSNVARRLAESEERYISLFQENPTPMLLVEASTLMVVDANPAAAAFLGHSIEALEQSTIPALSGNPKLEGWKALQRKKAPEGFRFPDRVRAADGHLRDVEVSAVRLPHGGRTLLLATMQDQTGLKAAELELERLAAGVAQVTDAIVCLDSAGVVCYANPTFAKMMGRELAGLSGQSLPELLPVPTLVQGVAGVLKGQPWDGRFPFQVGGVRREFRATLSPVHDSVEDGTSAVAVIRDITKGVELDRQLRQSEKMDALGTLAAGIAHDFNNVLTTILSAAELIKSKLPEDSAILSKVDAILHAGLCASGLNRQILAFSRKTEEKSIPLDLSATLRDAVQMLQSTLPPSVELRSKLTSGLWVEGDPAQLHQVVLNLVINAYHALPDGKGLIEVHLSEIQPGEAGIPAGLESHRCAVIQVRDNGSGIEPALLGRIFEPFFTTRNENTGNEGTGLGLAMVHATVVQSGGRISVASELGQGTVFIIHLPCATGVPQHTEDRRPEDVGGTERLLMVEDEDLVAALAKQGLQNLGYRVTTFAQPLEALEDFRRHPNRFDLVLVDLAMPEMNGADLTGKLQEIRPNLPVILVTGLPPATALSLNARASFRGVVPKPFTAFDLAKVVRRVLGPARRVPQDKDSAAIDAPIPARDPSITNILLAEDSATTRGMIRNWLEQEGYRVHAASDGLEAWDCFNREDGRFDLLLTDIVMPRMDGLELSQLVRNADPSIPIAVLTSSGDQETVKTALHMGVKDYLNKPFEKQDLLASIRLLIAERSALLDARRSVETAQAVRLAQKALVATSEKDLPLFSLYEPLSDAGGDIFRCLRCVDHSIIFVLADVAGHSVSSSYAVASFLTMLSTFIAGCGELCQLVRGEVCALEKRNCPFHAEGSCQPLRHLALKFNHFIQEGPFSEVPVCALLGHWQPATGRLQILNAGIPHPMLYLAGEDLVKEIEINGTPLGIFDEPLVEEQVIQLMPGDRVLVGTDGFFDVLSPEQKIFQDLVPERWRNLSKTPMDASLATICEAARDFGNGVIADDLMVVAFEQPSLSTNGHAFALRLPSNATSVDHACDRLRGFLDERARVESSRRFDIVLAVREALINAVGHGNAGSEDARISLRVALDENPWTLTVGVVDEGPGFDLAAHAPPSDPLSERGRGIPLIRNFAKDLRMVGGEMSMTFELEVARDNQ